jgi:predicted RNA-binding protein YlxR (DUF448 family)
MHVEMPLNERRDRKHGPTRTCVGCGLRDDAAALLRLVVAEGEVAFDLAGGAFGRGAHLHGRPACIGKAPRGLARTLRFDRAPASADSTPPQGLASVDAGQLGRRLVEACDRRIAGLLLAAHRSRALAVGADAALEALGRGAPLAVVATDAGTIATTVEVVRCVAEGRAIAWSTRSELGSLFGEQSVAICAVRHAGIGAELKRMRAAADAGATATREGAGCSSRCPEAR